MIRCLPLLALFACARLPVIETCDPDGELIQPSFLNVGNDDHMVASLSYTGCKETWFQLCAPVYDWLSEDMAELAIWHDGETIDQCGDEILLDEQFSLGPVRRSYEDRFEVEQGDLVIAIGDVEVDYSFAPQP